MPSALFSSLELGKEMTRIYETWWLEELMIIKQWMEGIREVGTKRKPFRTFGTVTWVLLFLWICQVSWCSIYLALRKSPNKYFTSTRSCCRSSNLNFYLFQAHSRKLSGAGQISTWWKCSSHILHYIFPRKLICKQDRPWPSIYNVLRYGVMCSQIWFLNPSTSQVIFPGLPHLRT